MRESLISNNHNKNLSESIRFAPFNIQGIITKRLNKLQTSELQSIFKNNDLVCLTESWGDSSQNFDYEGFTRYELHRYEKKLTCTRNSGGIIIYVKNELVSDDTLFHKCNDTHIWLKLKSNYFDLQNDVYI